MPKSSTTRNNLLQLIFNGENWANIADNASSASATQFYAALHTANPGAGGTQATFECAYSGYARAAITRDSSGFTIVSNSVQNTAAIEFPIAGVSSATATYGSIGMLASGAGIILYSGLLRVPVLISVGVTPLIPVGILILEF